MPFIVADSAGSVSEALLASVAGLTLAASLLQLVRVRMYRTAMRRLRRRLDWHELAPSLKPDEPEGDEDQPSPEPPRSLPEDPGATLNGARRPDGLPLETPFTDQLSASEEALNTFVLTGHTDNEKGNLQHAKLMESYHAQGLAQSQAWFRFSLVFAALGFALIAATVVTAALDSSAGVSGANVISLIAGIVIEAVSALFFVQANAARSLMAEFFDRLRSDRSRTLALEVANQIDEEGIRARLLAAIALGLADSDNIHEILPLVLDRDSASVELATNSALD